MDRSSNRGVGFWRRSAGPLAARRIISFSRKDVRDGIRECGRCRGRRGRGGEGRPLGALDDHRCCPERGTRVARQAPEGGLRLLPAVRHPADAEKNVGEVRSIGRRHGVDRGCGPRHPLVPGTQPRVFRLAPADRPQQQHRPPAPACPIGRERVPARFRIAQHPRPLRCRPGAPHGRDRAGREGDGEALHGSQGGAPPPGLG